MFWFYGPQLYCLVQFPLLSLTSFPRPDSRQTKFETSWWWVGRDQIRAKSKVNIRLVWWLETQLQMNTNLALYLLDVTCCSNVKHNSTLHYIYLADTFREQFCGRSQNANVCVPLTDVAGDRTTKYTIYGQLHSQLQLTTIFIFNFNYIWE